MAPVSTRRRPPPTRRLIRRVIAALLFGFALLALLKSGLLPQSALGPQPGAPEAAPTGPLARLEARIFPPRVDWSNDYAMVQELRRRIAADGLSEAKPNCLLFIINGNDPPADTRVRVLAKHNADCGGDPKTMPDLFLVKVDRSKGTALADAGQRGQFKPLK